MSYLRWVGFFSTFPHACMMGLILFLIFGNYLAISIDTDVWEFFNLVIHGIVDTKVSY